MPQDAQRDRAHARLVPGQQQAEGVDIARLRLSDQISVGRHDVPHAAKATNTFRPATTGACPATAAGPASLMGLTEKDDGPVTNARAALS
ncbi:hypothetical protein Pmi06nite_59840 [Planotetraspora mira]|uniref:Uncharacterized protein n=1 Tax=Planotetraspora mira TaxID=58121 RepID=A0A8J3X8V9_9ACTN|nr:hypothetical protein Pmi06nite_59840 [Planotetraspora mira]